MSGMPLGEAAELLGVAEDAPPGDVQRAFLRAARRVHPDVLDEAGDDERREAGASFDRMLRARDALLTAPRATGGAHAVPADASAHRRDPEGPVYRRVPGRGLGGSLVVLALLAFLLVALVSFEQGVQVGFEPGPSRPSVSSAP